ncbi:hypothetical protein LOK49_LG13G01703 [Camellia lanceoleosa]|uniref:Uncharacterized protein n=1 Tax=Camellia lanceoleosa TaxID=1840588 RepID=A0ACC0FHF0_9ERIC|nr:hypothetical protein LOK49_LG13G01703 [Camellia lanceoleosa]
MEVVMACWEIEQSLQSLTGNYISKAMKEEVLYGLKFMKEDQLDMDSSRNPESGEDRRVIAPQEACNQIAEVVQEALKKMEMVADEKMRMFKKAHRTLEASELELDEKAREVAELNFSEASCKPIRHIISVAIHTGETNKSCKISNSSTDILRVVGFNIGSMTF